MSNSSVGLVKSDPMNTTKGRVPHNYSSFSESLSYKKYMLLRYADYTPSFEMEGVPKDDIRLNTKDIIDSLSLNSPFKGVVRKIKESFKVPNMALLPLNWDLIYTQPSVGGDVPQDANCVITDFPRRFATVWKKCISETYSNVITSSSTAAQVGAWLTALMRSLILGEYVYSKGSLLNVCGYKASGQFEHLSTALSKGTYDQLFDSVVTATFRNVRYFKFTSNGVVRFFKGLSGTFFGATNERYYGEFRSFLDLMRENPAGSISVDLSSTVSSIDNAFYTSVSALCTSGGLLDVNKFRFIYPPVSASVASEGPLTELNPNVLNLSRLLAYQLIFFHFYTNSSIDPVYSADLYRQYINSLVRASIPAISSNPNYDQFTLNGRFLPYDYLSGHMVSIPLIGSVNPNVDWIPDYSVISANNNTFINARFAAWSAIFGTRHSLRYGDYFVGSRPRPLAPINTDVAVNNGYVSVIDITQNQWNQRFGNAVMRSRQKVENYVDMLFGKKPDIDWHNPLFLSREIDTVYGDEVQNTGAAQLGNSTQLANSRTSNLRGGLGQFTFTFHNDDMHSCIYLQIISFDIKRAYTRSVDRQFLHVDRYDMFNPSFQYIGDQPVYGVELGYPDGPANATLAMPAVFGYQSRDMEYKQRFDVVCSGFEDNLPGWILTDADRSKNNRGVLDADFIRNENSELDKFFLSLTGYSLGSYFHFICITQNNVFAKRAMSVDPQILG